MIDFIYYKDRNFLFQILSRAQGQLNTLAGQVASMKAMTEATTSVQNNLGNMDITNVPQVISQNDTTTLNTGQPLSNGACAASGSVQIDTSAMSVTDNNSCNGSGILVFQQKAATAVNNTSPANVSVLVRYIKMINVYYLTICDPGEYLICYPK